MLLALVYIGIALWVVYCILSSQCPGESLGMKAGVSALVIFMASLVVFVAGLTTSAIFTSGDEWYYVRTDTQPIVSLRTQQTISGSFVLGSGGFASNECYYFMVNLGDNHYQRDYEMASNTALHETTGTPCLTKEVYDETNKHAAWAWPLAFRFHRAQWYNRTLHVPPGTIIQKFEVQ